MTENTRGLTKAGVPPEKNRGEETNRLLALLRNRGRRQHRPDIDIDIDIGDPGAGTATNEVVEDHPVLVPSAVAVTVAAAVAVDPRLGIGKKQRGANRVNEESIPRKVDAERTVVSVVTKAGVEAEAEAVAENEKNLQSTKRIKNRLRNLSRPKSLKFLRSRLQMGRMVLM